jgi:hypothetical protein
MNISFDNLKVFFNYKPDKKTDGFILLFTRGDTNKLFRYDSSKFSKFGKWIIERCDNKIIILSLEELNDKSKYRFHITIYPKAWNDSGEFHVTSESIERLPTGIISNILCTSYYQLYIEKNKLYCNEINNILSKRPSCNSGKHFKGITDNYANEFKTLIKNYMTVKKLK